MRRAIAASLPPPVPTPRIHLPRILTACFTTSSISAPPGFATTHPNPPTQSFGSYLLTQCETSPLSFPSSSSGWRLLHARPIHGYPRSRPVQQHQSPTLPAAPGSIILRSLTNNATNEDRQTAIGKSDSKGVADQTVSQKPDGGLRDASTTQTLPPTSKSLPSEHLSRRSILSARFNSYMEALLNSLALLSQRVNTYTGTDYSGISALRDAIIDQEGLVRSRHDLLSETKKAHVSAIAAQSSSHREVVKLLERKHSWSEGDLEHYMALVRSEHSNEQAVQAAGDAVAEAERSLEEARVRLEKIERQQYHEEQIWSDTIRRNSTWVTFGLMGFNIVLLLAGLVAVEPWRRRRLVKEIEKRLDERSTITRADLSAGTNAALESPAGPQLRIELLDTLQEAEADAPLNLVQEATPDTAGPSALDDQQQISAAPESPPIPPSSLASATAHADTWSASFALWRAYWADLFSERRIILTRVDLTAATLEGAAAGAALTGLLFVLFRPR